MTDSTILLVDKAKMRRFLHQQHALSGRFIAHMLARSIRIEQDLADPLFNSSERPPVRALFATSRPPLRLWTGQATLSPRAA